jgi:rhamnopyranosyl-N-acetylglucosaminyl-diphospho-decaprenol beta-1,3/1,4-galactofuranosyltransferase
MAARLLGVLVTYRRPSRLAATLEWLGGQDRRLDSLVVVDNAPSDESCREVEALRSRGYPVEYVRAPENLGPAGGRALGMDHLLPDAQDDDWLVMLDDDVRPYPETTIGDLERFALEMMARDPRTGAVGLRGVRFDWSRARAARVPDEELNGPVWVDYHPTGHIPFYLVRAVREVGSFHAPLFIGLTEMEFGLRLRRTGFALYAPAESVRQSRAIRTGVGVRPSLKVVEPDWRRYYSLRNLIYILRTYGLSGRAIEVTLVRGLAKPLVNLLFSPSAAARSFRLNARACWDAWAGNMGRTVEPDESYAA